MIPYYEIDDVMPDVEQIVKDAFEEIWLDIEGYEGYYQVSSKGRVKSLRRKDKRGHNLQERILKLGLVGKGYHAVKLCKAGIKKTALVHRLVALTFIPNPENKSEVNHKNGVKTYNFVVNLEWATSLENMKHRTLCSKCGGPI
jgi:hypothetical protein